MKFLTKEHQDSYEDAKICYICTEKFENKSETDPEILKKADALCRPPWLTGKENFRFQMI